MLADVNDQKVPGYLGRALSLELSAVQFYSFQSRLVSNWGLDKAAERLRREAREEMQHAERIIARMIAVGVAPSASQLRPVKLAPDLPALLKLNQQFELELVQLYQDAAAYCTRIGYTNDAVFFQTLLSEERQHAQDLQQWIDSLQAEPAQALAGAM